MVLCLFLVFLLVAGCINGVSASKCSYHYNRGDIINITSVNYNDYGVCSYSDTISAYYRSSLFQLVDYGTNYNTFEAFNKGFNSVVTDIVFGHGGNHYIFIVF
jgi:hypothetical protein